MDSLGKRIRTVIAYEGINMTQFAKDLNISQSMVSKICSDKATPSDRTISDICRVYHVNRDWLTSGKGEMRNAAAAEMDYKQLFEQFYEKDPDMAQVFISALAKFPPVSLPIILDFLKDLAENLANKPKEYIDAYDPDLLEGYQAGIRAGEAARKALKELDEELYRDDTNQNDLE